LSGLAEIARQVAPDSWQSRILSAGSRLGELAAAIKAEQLPPPAGYLLIQAATISRLSDAAIISRFEAVQRQPADDFWINFALARYCESIQPARLPGAVRYYAAAAALRPRSAAVRSNLGAALQKQGRRSEALAEYRRAVQLDPQFAVAYINLGSVLLEEGRFDEAAAEVQKATALRPELAAAHRLLGVVLARQGHVRRAIQSLERAIELAPKAAGQHYDLGQMQQSIGRSREAMLAFEREIELQPDDVRGYNNLAALLEAAGRRDEALQHYQRAAIMAPAYYLARRNLATCLMRMGRFDEAIEQCLQGLESAASDRTATERFRDLMGDAQRFAAFDSRFADIASGEKEPATANEAIDFARLARIRRQYELAARCYAAAFAKADALKTAHRYNAACAAVLASTGTVAEHDPFEAERKTPLRHLALQWLTAELESLRQRGSTGAASSGLSVLRSLRQWQTDPDLAAVRDEALVHELPSADQRDWREFWSAVERVLQEVEAMH
jgi:tetratricopeptide (TPR) repeat protein